MPDDGVAVAGEGGSGEAAVVVRFADGKELGFEGEVFDFGVSEVDEDAFSIDATTSEAQGAGGVGEAAGGLPVF